MKLEEQIRSRRSVRKYTDETLTDEALSLIQNEISAPTQPFPSHPARFSLIYLRDTRDENGIGLLGGLAKINAPYCIAAISDGSDEGNIAAGFLLEKTVLEMTAHGLGTCWVATFNREFFSKKCALANGEIVVCTVVFGIPFGGGFMNGGLRVLAGSTKRKKPDEIFTGLNRAELAKEKDKLGHIAGLAILAPSGGNRQPVSVTIGESSANFYCPDGGALDTGIFASHFFLSCAEAGMKPCLTRREGEIDSMDKPKNKKYALTITYTLDGTDGRHKNRR